MPASIGLNMHPILLLGRRIRLPRFTYGAGFPAYTIFSVFNERSYSFYSFFYGNKKPRFVGGASWFVIFRLQVIW